MNLFGINLETGDLWLLAAAGACAAWVIPHFLSKVRDRESAFREASVSFLAAIDISDLSNSGSRARYNDFLSAFDGHAKAAANFRVFLGPINRLRFDRAWKEYQDHHHHRPADFEGLESHLENLRKFADPT